MKKNITFSILAVVCNLLLVKAQFFQGSFSLGTNDTLVFKIKSTGGDITTRIAYMEFAFRYNSSQAPGLTASQPVSMVSNFGNNLSLVAYPPNYINGGYTYLKYVHNAGALDLKTFISGTEYEVFKVKLSQPPTQSMGIEMASDLTANNFLFGIVDANDHFYNPGNSDQLYGTGFYILGTGHFLPLFGIVSPAAPVVSTPVEYCQNTTALPLTATGTNLLWYSTLTGGIGSNTAPTPSTVAVGSTTYYVSQTINGNESPRSAIVVNINAIPSTPTINSPITYCQNATATALTATGTNLLWYNVSTGGTGSINAPIPSTATVGSSNYFVSQTVGGCESDRATLVVTVNTVPTNPIVSSPVSYCQNSTALPLTATGSNLLWYNVSSGGIGNVNAPIPSTTTPGTTFYYVTQTTNGCESNRSTISVVINPTPSAPGVTTPQNICINATSTPLNANGTNLLWYSTPTLGVGDPNAPTPNTSNAGSTSYYVSQTINNCESPRALIVTNIVTQTTPTFSNLSTVCFEGAIPLLPATSSNGVAGFWNPATVSNLTSGNYLFTPNANQCAVNVNIQISVIPNPYSNIRYSTVNASANTNVTLQARPLTGATYNWNPAIGLNNAIINSPIFNYYQSQEYLINIISNEGCKITDTLFVKVKDQSNILVADAFSPNGDGRNDIIMPMLVEIKTFKYFKIFDRWGQVVFQTKEINKGWDGLFKGIKQPMETYLWIAEGIDNFDQPIKKTGSFILLR